MKPTAVEIDVRERLRGVRERIAAAAQRAGRQPDDVTLVAISKRQPLERVVAAVRAGVRRLGENYVQDARERIPAVAQALAGSDTAPPIWHMVGQLQRNKCRDAARDFDVIESVDRESLALELDRRAARAERAVDVLLQVNLSGEPQKGGVDPEGLPALLAACAPLSRLRVRGLMTVPAAAADPEASRPAFAQLRELRDTLATARGGEGLCELSMGMSHDFEVAIEEGATWVRVGTAVFGPRPDAVTAAGGPRDLAPGEPVS